jgi:DNA replication initiation complex subunit (GINS family)
VYWDALEDTPTHHGGKMEAEVKVTYETLFEILKREKDSADLQKLEPAFFDNFVEYLNEKKDLLNKDDALFSYDEKKKVEKQIDNARRLIKEIYERREKKILGIALIKSRTKSHVIDTSALMENEKKFLEDVERILNTYRENIIFSILQGKQILQRKAEDKVTKEEINDVDKPGGDIQNTKLVRFLHSVPKFVGTQLEEYGPFVEGDIANLPIEVADILINKGEVEEIKEN